MPLGLAAATLALVFGVVFVGGLVKGIAGFGYAVTSTALLATIVDPGGAVVLMILPTLVGNLSLTGELDREDLRPCLRRFWPYVGAAFVGTVAGMALLGRIPAPVLALTLGTLTIGYVAVKQDSVAIPGESRVAERCFQQTTGAKAGLGLGSGIVFGASNVGVQFVAYLDSLSLDRRTFVGVLASILVGVSMVRVVLAFVLGLYETGGLFAVSVAAAVPGLVGVHAGGRLRSVVPETCQRAGTLLLLSIIGAKLVHGGITGL